MLSDLWRGARPFPSAPPRAIRKTRPAPRPSFRPGVEALEGREVPACTVTVGPDAALGPNVSVLTITGDEGANSVLVTQDSGTGAFSVLCDGVLTPVTALVNKVVVRTLGGNDQVAVRDLRTASSFHFIPIRGGGIETDLGGGDDFFSFQLSNQQLLPSLKVTAGDGNDTVNVSLDNVSAQPPISIGSGITLDGGKGNDRLRVNAQNLLVSYVSDFGSTASFGNFPLAVALNGQGGADRLSADVIVSNLDAFPPNATFTLSGGSGPDRVSASTWGALVFRVRGEGGDDHLTLKARDLRKAVHHPDARLRGGPGTDVCRTAGRVRVDGCEL